MAVKPQIADVGCAGDRIVAATTVNPGVKHAVEDGEILAPGFSLDQEGLRSRFERVDGVSWQSLGSPGGEGPQVSIECAYRGHDVFLQVLAYPPEDAEPGMKLDRTRRGS